MKKFAGFPARMQFTPIPDLFFSALLDEIKEINELKVTLYLFKLLYRKRGSPRYATYRELLASRGLVKSLSGNRPPAEVLRGALDAATSRGTILHLNLERDGAKEDLYFLNTEENRKAIGRIQSGELSLDDFKFPKQAPIEVEISEPPDIFTLYEENIGMLTPMIAEELRQAEKLYPAPWIRDAFKEAVDLNKRSWRYIAAILERWTAEGKSDGTHRRDIKSKDPDRYIKGRYGHLVQR